MSENLGLRFLSSQIGHVTRELLPEIRHGAEDGFELPTERHQLVFGCRRYCAKTVRVNSDKMATTIENLIRGL